MTPVLFHTTGCHLCDLAQAMLDRAQDSGLINGYRCQDIIEDAQLVEQYGIQIPVICWQNKQLFWPFDYNGLHDFLLSHPK